MLQGCLNTRTTPCPQPHGLLPPASPGRWWRRADWQKRPCWAACHCAYSLHRRCYGAGVFESAMPRRLLCPQVCCVCQRFLQAGCWPPVRQFLRRVRSSAAAFRCHPAAHPAVRGCRRHRRNHTPCGGRGRQRVYTSVGVTGAGLVARLVTAPVVLRRADALQQLLVQRRAKHAPHLQRRTATTSARPTAKAVLIF